MSKPFEIKFDFPVASSNLKISLKVTAELYHSEPYYRVGDFYFENNVNLKHSHSVFPDQEIKRVRHEASEIWVHKDSERESLLSIAIGNAIEKALKKIPQE